MKSLCRFVIELLSSILCEIFIDKLFWCLITLDFHGVHFINLQWLVEYNAALASICFMVLLGFVDDVLDVPWRV